MIDDVLVENRRRHALAAADYDPLAGIGACGERVHDGERNVWVPRSMADDPLFITVGSDATAYDRLRCRHDFEFWAATCVRIRHKTTGHDVPFVLNRPQRRVVAILEDDRLQGRPLRVIMLKARQWGGSTLVQCYMAWIQSVHRRNWNSVICAHVKDTAAAIRGMYSHLLENYPEELWEGDERPQFRPFERSVNTRLITGRGCKVTVASAEKQDGVRGLDVSMAHLSEVAFWPDSRMRSGADFATAICSGVPQVPCSLIVLESTANGVGGYFHSQWLLAERGESVFRPVFVPWYEIEIYSCDVTDAEGLWKSLTSYERELWERTNVTLEQLAWYHAMRRTVPSDAAMKAEFPSSAVEAFISTGRGVFAIAAVERLRGGCRPPAMVGEVRGDGSKGRAALRNVRFVVDDEKGLLRVWHVPDNAIPGCRNRYVVTVDVGGRSAGSDYSVIAVLERRRSDVPRVVAQWRGHIDHDLLGWKAAAIARWYNNALLVVESNTLETEWDGSSLYILEAVADVYRNLYFREHRDVAGGATVDRRAGFHTNRATKQAVITTLVAMVRDGGYVEADDAACDELLTYEQLPGGSYAARQGHHDDMLMTRAIALHVIDSMPAPRMESVEGLLNAPSW